MSTRTARTRPNRKARRAAKAKTKVNVVGEEKLQELRDLKEEADLAQTEANLAGAEFQTAIARVFREAKAPIQESAICLQCGTVRPREIQNCPECPPPGAPAPMPPPEEDDEE